MERSILRGGVRTTIHDSGNMTEFPLLGKCAQIDAFVRGASRRTMSSLALGWSGMVIERHSADAAERQESVSPHHILALWETHTFQTEHCDAHGAVVRVKKNPGWIDFFPAGILSSCRSTGPSKMVVCAFNPEFAKEVAEDLGLGSAGDLTGFSTTEGRNPAQSGEDSGVGSRDGWCPWTPLRRPSSTRTYHPYSFPRERQKAKQICIRSSEPFASASV